jgi:nucleotide-binding universal stress UspA family protein
MVLLGSVLQSVLEHAPCPVLVARAPRAAESMSNPHKVLIAVDGSAMSNLAMQWLTLHAWNPDTHFCFVSVVPPMDDDFSSEGIEQAVADLGKRVDFEDRIAGLVEEAIDKFAPDVKRFSYSVETPTGDPTEEILRIAEREKASVIVVGSHGRTGMKRLLLGSVSQSLAARGACSVLVVKSAEFAGASVEDAMHELEDTQIMHHAESEIAHRVPYLH